METQFENPDPLISQQKQQGTTSSLFRRKKWAQRSCSRWGREQLVRILWKPQVPRPAGSGGRSLCANAAALHIAQPLGPGGACGAAEHGADQPDAERPEPRGLRQRAGERGARQESAGWGGHPAATKPRTSAHCALGAGLMGVPL